MEAPSFRRSSGRASRPYRTHPHRSRISAHADQDASRAFTDRDPRRGGWRVPTIAGPLTIPPRLPPDTIPAEPKAFRDERQRCARSTSGGRRDGAPSFRRSSGRASRPYRTHPPRSRISAHADQDARRSERATKTDKRVGAAGAAAEHCPVAEPPPPSPGARAASRTRPKAAPRDAPRRARNNAAARGDAGRTNHPTRKSPARTSNKPCDQRRQHVVRAGAAAQPLPRGGAAAPAARRASLEARGQYATAARGQYATAARGQYPHETRGQYA